MNKKSYLSLKALLVFYSIVLIFINFFMSYFVGDVAKGMYYQEATMKMVKDYGESICLSYPNYEKKVDEIISRNIDFEIYDITTSTIVFSTRMQANQKIELKEHVDIKQVMDGYIVESEEGVITSTNNETAYKSLNILTNDKVEKYYYLCAIDDSKYLIMHVYASAIVQATELSKTLALVSCLWTTVLVGPFSILISVWISSKIKKLKKYAKEVEQHNFLTPVKKTDIKEFDEVINSINHMGSSLKTYLNEIGRSMNEMQKNIEMKEKAEEKQKTFISDISHEIKTPLTIISAYAEALEMGVAETPDEIKEYSTLILSECKRMTQMAQDLITLVKIESDVNVVPEEWFDLNEAMNNIKKKFIALCESTDIKISFDSDNHYYAFADVYRIDNVITNYVQNAYKYCSKPGNIKIKLSVNNDSKLIRISVFNNGEGIADKDIDNIWDRFYKVDRARTRNETSTGIGLAIVKTTMEQCGLPYGVYNTDDGVCFYIEVKGAIVDDMGNKTDIN